MVPKDHVKTAPLVGFGRDHLALANSWLTMRMNKYNPTFCERPPPGYTAVPTRSDQLAANFSANLTRHPCNYQQPFYN